MSTSNINELAISKRDYKLSNGRILSIGINFRTLVLLTSYEGGFDKLKNDMQSNDISSKMNACAYFLYTLIRAAGEEVDIEEASMMIGLEDIDRLYDVFEDFSEAMEKMQKKTILKQKKFEKLNGQN